MNKVLIEHGMDLFISFGNLKKAFDNEDWVRKLQTLKNIGVDRKNRSLKTNLCMQQKALIKIMKEFQRKGRGVRHMSPQLVTMYAEAMTVEAMDRIDVDEAMMVEEMERRRRWRIEEADADPRMVEEW